MNLTRKISISILNRIMQEKAVDEKDYRKALYGFEIIISVLFQAAGLIILGMLLGILDRMIPVALSFALLRSFAGGYHADTCFKCFIMTFVMCVVGIRFAEIASVSIVGMLMMAAVSLVLVLKLAPRDTRHKRMTEKSRSINRKKSIMVLVVLSAIALGLFAYSSIDSLYPALVISGLLMESISLLIKTD